MSQASLALYRKYRSKSLDEIVGQEHITRLLSKAVASGRISHAYLLTGPRGVGKTSVARILAHEINQLPYDESSTPLDIIEIDAASNNGVDDVRDLREKVQLAPVSATKKVYIIDEVHMLTKQAFNALLKTLEEPPEHVVFILATTDVDKLPATIVSRAQRYGFRSISPADAVKHLRHIADQEKIKIDDEALTLIAERGDGSFRDSISLLDQLANLADEKEGVTSELIEATLGLAPTTVVNDIIDAADQHQLSHLAELLDGASQQGVEASILAQQLIARLRTKSLETPSYVTLIDSLLDVAKSSQPTMKLFTVLGSYAEHKTPKTAALATPVREVTATIEELTKQATKKEPKVPEIKTVTEPKGEPRDFDWTALIEHTRRNYVALYSVLSKCGHQRLDDTIIIYTGNAFYKKKLDDAKYTPHLYESLTAIGHTDLAIETIPTVAPPKSSQAAAVVAIMGGGEEVSVEE